MLKQGSHDGSVHHNEIYQMQKVALYVDAYDLHTYNVNVYANRIHDVRMGITLAYRQRCATRTSRSTIM